LHEEDINNVLFLLRKNSKINKIILFGSRAKGTYKTGSDIDLALIGPGLNLNDVLDASVEIEKLSLPYKFDLIIFEKIKEEALIEHIKRVGIVLYDIH
jgi:predicted nucleotidyltransferase